EGQDPPAGSQPAAESLVRYSRPWLWTQRRRRVVTEQVNFCHPQQRGGFQGIAGQLTLEFRFRFFHLARSKERFPQGSVEARLGRLRRERLPVGESRVIPKMALRQNVSRHPLGPGGGAI